MLSEATLTNYYRDKGLEILEREIQGLQRLRSAKFISFTKREPLDVQKQWVSWWKRFFEVRERHR